MIKNFIKIAAGIVCCSVLFVDCEGMQNALKIVKPSINKLNLKITLNSGRFKQKAENSQKIENLSSFIPVKNWRPNTSRKKHAPNLHLLEVSSLRTYPEKTQIKNKDNPVISILKTPGSNEKNISKKKVTFEQRLSENSQNLLNSIHDNNILEVLSSSCWQYKFSIEDFQETMTYIYKNEKELLADFMSIFAQTYSNRRLIFYKDGQKVKSMDKMVAGLVCTFIKSEQLELSQMLIQADINYRESLTESNPFKNWHAYKYAVDYLVYEKKFNELEVLLGVLKRVFPDLSLQDLAYPSGVNWFEKNMSDYQELRDLKRYFDD